MIESRGKLCTVRLNAQWSPAFADEMASTCDRVAARIADELGLPAASPIEVELLDFSPILPGVNISAYTLFPPGRIVIGAPALIQSGGEAVVAHEMCHFLLAKHGVVLPFVLEEALAQRSETVGGADASMACTLSDGAGESERLPWLEVDSLSQMAALPKATLWAYLAEAMRVVDRLGMQQVVELGRRPDTDWKSILATENCAAGKGGT
jgi:hypothetical protein